MRRGCFTTIFASLEMHIIKINTYFIVFFYLANLGSNITWDCRKVISSTYHDTEVNDVYNASQKRLPKCYAEMMNNAITQLPLVSYCIAFTIIFDNF